MQTLTSVCVCFFLFFNIIIGLAFKVAVYEHVVISPEEPEGNFTRDEAFAWMLKNLEIYEEQVQEAAAQGAQMIVFPEYGITGFDHSRDSMVPFLEDIPNPSEAWNPCEQPLRFPNTRVLNRLSCMAKESKIYLVANMGDIKSCDKNCPKDGRYQFNTNVVFDATGILISRYHKRNMYDETPLFDSSPSVEYAIFETPFGTFGTVVCFDILNYFPTQILLEEKNIRNLIVTSAWNAFFPFVLPIQMYSGLAKRNHINVIAANIRNQDYMMASSGVFGANTEVFSDPDFTSPTGELLIADLTDPKKIAVGPETQLEPFTVKPNDQGYHGAYDYGMNLTFVILDDVKRPVSVCAGKTCCIAEYEFDFKKEDEVFILAASQFSTTHLATINLEFCAVHKCLTNNITTCGKSVSSSESIFSRLKLQGLFANAIVFPFVATSPKENRSVSVDMHSYRFDRKRAILESDGFKHPLLSAVVYNSMSYNEVPKSNESKSSSATICILLSLITPSASSLFWGKWMHLQI